MTDVPTEPAEQTKTESESQQPGPFETGGPIGPRMRAFMIFSGAVYPAITLCMAFVRPGLGQISSPWQSGKLEDYAALLLMPDSLAMMLPIVIWSSASLVVAATNPTNRQRLPIRLGVYGGTLIAAHFQCVLFITSSFFSLILAAAWMLFIQTPLNEIVVRFRRFSIAWLMILTAMAATVMAALIHFAPDDDTFIYVTAMVVWMAASSVPMTVLAFAIMSMGLVRERQSRDLPWNSSGDVKATLGLLALPTAYAASTVASMNQMLDAYSRLPTTNPNCFVGSAAAKGSPRWVKSQIRQDGLPINRQMQRLKFLELAVLASWPGAHRIARQFYDWLGPKLARGFQSRGMANLAFLILKPIEYFASGIAWKIGIDSKKLDQIYLSKSDDFSNHH